MESFGWVFSFFFFFSAAVCLCYLMIDLAGPLVVKMVCLFGNCWCVGELNSELCKVGGGCSRFFFPSGEMLAGSSFAREVNRVWLLVFDERVSVLSGRLENE